MNRFLAAALVAGALHGIPATAASVTLATMADTEDGLSYGVSGHFAPSEYWSVGAGIEQSETRLGDADFSGTALRLSTDLYVGGFTGGASVRRWKDSSQVEALTVLVELGWMGQNGLSFSVLMDDRNMTVQYTTTVLGVTRPASIDFNGTGYGADVSWLVADWNLGARFLDYDYGRSVTRVRAAIESAGTQRFPVVDSLLQSIVTRASGAPDQQLLATLGRRFDNSSLQADWSLQRDALTTDKVKTLSLTWGYGLGDRLWLDTTAGISDIAGGDSLVFGGLALTWRQASAD
jgi:hypothetical protein